ncbi:MAG: hypothetical protein FJ387_26010 [Verrucomicrobia bacterium]|nr:hypothetical protein [Verrucomicrobiota bacterium]
MIAGSVLLSSNPIHAQAAPLKPADTPEEHDARMVWWREARFGMFVRWGIYAVVGGESCPREVWVGGGRRDFEMRGPPDRRGVGPGAATDGRAPRSGPIGGLALRDALQSRRRGSSPCCATSGIRSSRTFTLQLTATGTPRCSRP